MLIGDAELDEGSNHEAIALAGRARTRPRCTVVVIDNLSSSYAVSGRDRAAFRTEGWHAVTVDGRDHDALEAALTATAPGRPSAVVATVEEKRLTSTDPRERSRAPASTLVDADPRRRWCTPRSPGSTSARWRAATPTG